MLAPAEPFDSEGRFRLWREGLFDRLAKSIGLAVEMRTGDRRFDRSVYVDTHDAGFVRECFAEPERRALVLALIDGDVDQLEIDRRQLKARIRSTTMRRTREAQSRAFVERLVPRLAGLRDALPERLDPRSLEGRRAWRRRLILVHGIAGAAALLGIASAFGGSTWYPVLDDRALVRASLDYSIPAVAAFLALAFLALRGYSGAHHHFALAVLLGVTGVGILGYGALACANGYLDTAAPRTSPALVTDKSLGGSSRSRTYRLRVRIEREPSGHGSLEVSPEVYRRVRAGATRLELTTRPGHLGFEWVVAWHVVR